MTPEQVDRVFGRGRLKMATGDHVEVFREAAPPGERRRYTKRFLSTHEGDFGQWTEREWRILARLIGHGIGCVPDVVHFDRGARGGTRVVQTYDAGATVDQWATILPVARRGRVYRYVFEDCAHWWALAHHCLRALAAIHELQLVHLDIKGDNVCIPLGPASFDPDLAGARLFPQFEQLALIDFAFSLISRETLTTPLPIGWQKSYDYQSPRLLHALESGRNGDLQPTRDLDWRCDMYGLAAMLKRYLPDDDFVRGHEGATGWSVARYRAAKGLILTLRDAHDREPPQVRPHQDLLDITRQQLAEADMIASLDAGWTLARDANVAGVPALPLTPLTRLAPSLRATNAPSSTAGLPPIVVSPRAPRAPPRVIRRRAPATVHVAAPTNDRVRPSRSRVWLTPVLLMLIGATTVVGVVPHAFGPGFRYDSVTHAADSLRRAFAAWREGQGHAASDQPRDTRGDVRDAGGTATQDAARAKEVRDAAGMAGAAAASDGPAGAPTDAPIAGESSQAEQPARDDAASPAATSNAPANLAVPMGHDGPAASPLSAALASASVDSRAGPVVSGGERAAIRSKSGGARASAAQTHAMPGSARPAAGRSATVASRSTGGRHAAASDVLGASSKMTVAPSNRTRTPAPGTTRLSHLAANASVAAADSNRGVSPEHAPALSPTTVGHATPGPPTTGHVTSAPTSAAGQATPAPPTATTTAHETPAPPTAATTAHATPAPTNALPVTAEASPPTAPPAPSSSPATASPPADAKLGVGAVGRSKQAPPGFLTSLLNLARRDGRAAPIEERSAQTAQPPARAKAAPINVSRQDAAGTPPSSSATAPPSTALRVASADSAPAPMPAPAAPAALPRASAPPDATFQDKTAAAGPAPSHRAGTPDDLQPDKALVALAPPRRALMPADLGSEERSMVAPPSSAKPRAPVPADLAFGDRALESPDSALATDRDVYLQQGRRTLVYVVPRTAAYAEPQIERVLASAAESQQRTQQYAIVDAARRRWSRDAIPLAGPPSAPALARRLNDEARRALWTRRDVDEALDLQVQALGANPQDIEVASNLAALYLKVNPPKPRLARQVVMHAMALGSAQLVAPRVQDWNTFAVASALMGREEDAMRALFVTSAITSNLGVTCRAALTAYASYGDPLRVPVEAMLSRIREQGRDDESPYCVWPPRWNAGARFY